MSNSKGLSQPAPLSPKAIPFFFLRWATGFTQRMRGATKSGFGLPYVPSEGVDVREERGYQED